jgi:CspA family cold shock protein
MPNTGTIKKLVMERGYGFIRPQEGGSDIFFHCSALPQKGDFDSLTEGLKVEFTQAEGSNGRTKAENVAVQT